MNFITCVHMAAFKTRTGHVTTLGACSISLRNFAISNEPICDHVQHDVVIIVEVTAQFKF